MANNVAANSKRTLLYIMSPSYSGSTLLTSLLAGHPQVSTVGELKASGFGDVETYQCSCGELILECGFWSRVADHLGLLGDSLDFNRLGTHFISNNKLRSRIIASMVRGHILEIARKVGRVAVPSCAAEFQDILLKNKNLIDVICRLQGGEIFLDASKDPLRAKYFRESGLWDVKLIYLTRDGRGTVNSMRSHAGEEISSAAIKWVEKIREMDRLVDAETYFLKYEDLCEHTEDELVKLCHFAGLERLPDSKDEIPTVQHILGNAMRLRKFTGVRLDEKWRQVLSVADLREFSRIGGPVNERLGYTEQ